MNISQKGFIYRTAYFFSDAKDCPPVGDMNGCNLFWRFVFFGMLLVIFASIYYILLAIGTILFLVLNNTVGALFGFKFERNGEELSWSPFYRDNYPYIFGMRVLPGFILLFIALGAFQWKVLEGSFHDQVFSKDFLHNAIVSGWGNILFLEVIIIAIVSLILFISWIKEGELAGLVVASVRSFKDKTCPVIRIVE